MRAKTHEGKEGEGNSLHKETLKETEKSYTVERGESEKEERERER